MLRCKINATTGIRPEKCRSAESEWFCSGSTSDAVSGNAAFAGLGGVPPRNPFKEAWVVASVSAGDKPNEIVIDGAVNNVTAPVAVKYAWDMPGDCCKKDDPAQGKEYPCNIEACPVMTSPTNLPPNPFMVRIENGKCVCEAPQVCSN